MSTDSTQREHPAQPGEAAAAAAAKTAEREHAARVAAARGLIVVRNRTGKPIPDYVRKLAGPGWK